MIVRRLVLDWMAKSTGWFFTSQERKLHAKEERTKGEKVIRRCHLTRITLLYLQPTHGPGLVG